MNDAFRHLPELYGRIIPAAESGLRVSDEMLDAWDAQALAGGLGGDWRLSNEAIEASRRATLSTMAPSQDLWIFAYGSLMWDPGFHFAELRRATLQGYQRRFAHETTIGRGSPKQPGLVLSLEAQAGHCEGLAFRIEHSILEQESLIFWRREMILGGYQPRILPVSTPQGELQALALVSEPVRNCAALRRSLPEVAAVISQARGHLGSNLDYLRQVVEQLDHLQVNDDYISGLARLVGIGTSSGCDSVSSASPADAAPQSL